MTFTWLDLCTSVLAGLLFFPVLIAVGYAAAHALPGYRNLRASLQLLWAIALSLPVSLALSAVAGQALGGPAILTLFDALLALAVLLALPELRAEHLSRPVPVRLFLQVGLPLAAYVLLMTCPLQFHGRLYESVLASDWSVRVPLVWASIHNPVPAGNPFFSVGQHLAAPRYYFYWYALWAQAGRLHLGTFSLPARACLTASAFWAAASLLCTLALALHYFAGVTTRLRSMALLAACLCCVMGVDIVPALAGLLVSPHRITPDVEWWHADRIPSFLGAILFAPHHVGGLVCCVVAFLLLHVRAQNARANPSRSTHSSTLLLPGLAGVCLAAAAGDSTYIAVCFGFVGVLYALSLLWQRRWADLLALCAATVVALAIAFPFLHSVLSNPALPVSPSSHGSRFLALTLRESDDARHTLTFVAKRLPHHLLTPALLTLLSLPVVLVLVCAEFGFLLIPLLVRARLDWRRLRSGPPLRPGEQILWIIFLGALFPALFLSSEPTQGVNDLGRHAGLILRFVAIVWATPLLSPFLHRSRIRDTGPAFRRPLPGLTVLLVALGIVTQIWQIVGDRTYLLLCDRVHANPRVPFAADTSIGARYLDLRRALAQTEARLPPNAVVQSNMGSRYQPIVMLYSKQPFAAGDPSCELAFGGSPALCYPAVRALQGLFGGPSDVQDAPNAPFHTVFFRDARASTTKANFVAVCSRLRLSQILAQDSDPAWSIPGSWVWQQTPVYASSRVRVFACPAPSARSN